MKHLLSQCRNVGKITYLELLWGLRIPESVVYNVLAPSLMLLLLGLVRGSRDYLPILVPGLIALTTASSAMHGVGAKLSFMRSYGSWRTLQASPIPSGLYFAGLVGSRMVRILLVVGLMLTAAVSVLGYRPEGSLALMLLAVLLGTAVFGAVGLAIAAVVPSPQAVSGVMNLCLLVMLATGDVLFINDAPWVNTMSQFFPLTYLVDLIRGSLLNGWAGRGRVVDLGALAAWLAGAIWAALALARKRVEEK